MRTKAPARFPRYLSRTRNVSTCAMNSPADLFHVSIRVTQSFEILFKEVFQKD